MLVFDLLSVLAPLTSTIVVRTLAIVLSLASIVVLPLVGLLPFINFSFFCLFVAPLAGFGIKRIAANRALLVIRLLRGNVVRRSRTPSVRLFYFNLGNLRAGCKALQLLSAFLSLVVLSLLVGFDVRLKDASIWTCIQLLHHFFHFFTFVRNSSIHANSVW